MFDVDKMYLMMPEFKKVNNYNLHKAWTDFYEAHPTIKREIDDNHAKLLNQYIKEQTIDLDEEVDDEDFEDFRKEFNAWLKKEGVKQYSFSETAQQEFSKWFKGENKENYLIDQSIKKVTYKDNKSVQQNTTEARNNRMIDIINSVLTNKDTASKVFNPGSFDVQKKSARIINILKNTDYTYEELKDLDLDTLNNIIEQSKINSKVTIIDPTTQVYFHQQNTTAGKLIGVFANHNSSHSLLQNKKVSFILGTSLKFDGVEIDDSTTLDELFSQDGYNLITKNIAGFLAASVDAVKDPVLNFMNLNTFTANTAMTLARLGFDSDSIGLFLTQPIIEETTKEYFNKSNEGYVRAQSIIQDKITELLTQLGGEMTQEDIEKDLVNVEFSKEDMAKSLKGSDVRDKLNTLILYKNLLNMSDDLNTLTFITKFDTANNSVGPTIAESLSKFQKVEKFLKTQESEDKATMNNVLGALRQPIIYSFLKNLELASKKVMESNFIHFNDDTTTLRSKFAEDIDGDLNADLLDDLINDFAAFKLTQTDSTFKGDLQSRQHFLISFPNELLDKIQKNPALLENNLLKRLVSKRSTKRMPILSLQLNTGGLNIDDKEAIKNGWTDLYLNPETKDIALDLVKYNFYKSGFNFSPTSFMHLVPIEIKKALPNYIDSLRRDTNTSIFNTLSDKAIDTFILQFKRNNLHNNKIAPTIKADTEGIQKVNANTITIKADSALGKMLHKSTDQDGKKYLSLILIEEIKDGKKITFPWISEGKTNTYTKSTALGIPYNVVEYNLGDSASMETALPSNKKGIESNDNTKIYKTHEEGVKSLSKENKQYIDSLLATISKKSTQEIRQITSGKSKSRDKIIMLLRNLFKEEYENMDKNQRNNLINYFENVEVKDQEGNKIC